MKRDLLTLLVGLALALGSCGYRAGPVDPSKARTVAVPVFDNDTYWREIEVEMTQALVAEIDARSGLRLTAKPAAADLVLRGTIASFGKRVLADRGPGDVTESAVVVTLVVVVEDTRTGTRDRRTFRIEEPYSTTKGQSLASARAEAFENLAEQILYSLEDDWAGEPSPEEPS